MNQQLVRHEHEIGAVNIWLLLSIIFMVITAGLGGAFTWAYMNYTDQRDNVDTKVSAAVNTAVKAQADKDAATFEEADKKPNRQFSGPEDFGSLSFSYPKTWSVYVPEDASDGNGTYQAYLNPVLVPAVDDETQVALRVSIETQSYDTALENYNDLVQEGKLKTSTLKINGVDATRLDGNFTENIRGSAVVFKLRDKVVTIRTDADTFKNDFNALVATIKFNQ